VSGSSSVSVSSSLSAAGSSSSSSFFGQQRQQGSGLHLQQQRIHRSSSRAFATTAAAASNDTMHDARVVTYNVLSSSLCEPVYFTHCAVEDLDPPARLAKLKAKLEPEMARGAVIGLQEVSQKWAGDLHVFFAQRGYHLVCSLYGKPFNGYMGIALAVPLDRYEVSKVDISRCSDTARLPREPAPAGGVLRKIFVDKPLDLYRKARGGVGGVGGGGCNLFGVPKLLKSNSVEPTRWLKGVLVSQPPFEPPKTKPFGSFNKTRSTADVRLLCHRLVTCVECVCACVCVARVTER
jgi:hypothetical protein